MQTPPIPADEAARQLAVDRSGLVFTPAEERFDRLTRLAARLFETPFAAISLIDGERQWLKSTVGLKDQDSSRRTSFCAHALVDGKGMVIEDTHADSRFADHPLVIGDPHIRAYAGRLIRAESGHALGALCVIDSKPRQFTNDELALLEDLTSIVEGELRRHPGPSDALLDGMNRWARERALDPVTRCWNHDAMVDLLMRQAAVAEQSSAPFTVALLGVERLRQIERNLGAEARDDVMAAVAGTLRRVLGERGALGRYDAESFLVVLPATGEQAACAVSDEFRRAVNLASFRAGNLSVHVGLSAGVAAWRPGVGMVALVETASAALESARNARDVS